MTELFVLTAIKREFDGYDRWTRSSYLRYGERAELERLKIQLQRRGVDDVRFEDIKIYAASASERLNYITSLEKENQSCEANIARAEQLITLAKARIFHNKQKISAINTVEEDDPFVPDFDNFEDFFEF